MLRFYLITMMPIFSVTTLSGQGIANVSISYPCHLTIVVDNSLRFVRILADDSLSVKTISTDETSYFEEPVFFRFDGSTFLRVQEVVYGTAYANREHLYSVTEKCKLDSVRFDEASKGYLPKLLSNEVILKGEYRTFNDDEITFSFGIWDREDPNCCPSRGYVKGKYKLKRSNAGEKAKYRMFVSEQWLSPDY